MSDIMRPMSFEQLLNWTLTEHKKRGTVFGEHHPYHADPRYNRTIFERTLETPVGPAAGPHTQLAQNIVAAPNVLSFPKKPPIELIIHLLKLSA